MQDALTKNIEHVKMKKTSRQISGRGGAGMKTAEILEKTKTFQAAEVDILNNIGKITQVDMPMEYGRVCLSEQVRKHAELSFDLSHEVDTVEEFIRWMDESIGNEPSSVNMKDLYELASAETLLPEIKRYLTTEIANRLAAGTGHGKLVSISGIAYLNSREVMFFAGRLLEKMAKSLRVVVWLDSKEQGNLSENRLREMFCGEIFRIRPERMLLSPEDIRFLTDHRLPSRPEKERRQISEELRSYFGGLPAGVCYALDLMADDEKKLPVEYLCTMKNHPVYEQYGRNCLTKRFTEKGLEILKRLSDRKEIVGSSVREELKVQWAEEYLQVLKEEGILLCAREENHYLFPGVFRDYLRDERADKNICECRSYGEDKAESSMGKIMISSFGSFHVRYHGEEPKWRTKKTKELFAFLFNKQGVPVSRDMILGSLWPELEEDKARKLFYTTMAYLRKNLKEAGMPELVLCRKGMYFLDISRTESDYRAIMAIKEQLEKENWQELRKLPDIRRLYGGAYLEFCTEEWTYGIRAYMGRIVQQCLRSLGAYKMRTGEAAEAAEYLELFRNEDPYSEDVTAMLINAYGRLGDYKNASRVYRDFEELFRKEFGEKPGDEVQKAFAGCRKERRCG